MRRVSIIVVLALLAPAALGADCRPSYLEIGQEITATSHLADVSFHAILIGCEDRLTGMGEADMEASRAALAAWGSKVGIALEAVMSEPKYRAELVGEINRSLGRNVISDVFVYKFSFAEYRPAPE